MLTDVMKDFIVSAILSARDFSLILLMVARCHCHLPENPLKSHIHRHVGGVRWRRVFFLFSL